MTERTGSLFWLFVAVLVSIASFRLGIGSLNSPGTGFMPFYAALMLGILSIISFFQKGSEGKKGQSTPSFIGKKGIKVVIVFTGLMAYGALINIGGYNLITFLLMSLLFFVMEKQRLWKVAIYAFIATASTYYVFSKWLNCQFPLGPFGF